MKRSIAILLVAMLILTLPIGLQPSFAHNNGSYAHDSNNQTRNTDWMSVLPKSLLLSEISIPGTHDSMSNNEGLEYGGATAQCQSLSLEDQLLSGIRALDIRCVHYRNTNTDVDTFAIFHGAFYQKSNFDDVLSTVSAFLDAHPGETVLMRVKEEDPSMDMIPGFSLTDTPFYKTFEAYANKYAKEHSNVLWVPDDPFVIPTLRDVRGKIVILQDFDGKYDSVPNKGKNFGILWDTLDIQDSYNVNQSGMYDKWQLIQNQMSKANTSDFTQKFYVNYLSGTTPPVSNPYFVASGHLDPSTDSDRMWTGYFDHDSLIEEAVKFILDQFDKDYGGYYFDKGRWPDFPRKTLTFDVLGNNDSDYVPDDVEPIDDIDIRIILFEGMNGLTSSRLHNYDRVGIVMMDFPGPSLIDNIVHKNPWRHIPDVTMPDSGQHIKIFSGESISVAATFTDANDYSAHDASIDWGDQTTDTPATLVENATSTPGLVNGNHTYFAPCTYKVIVSVTDDENGTGYDYFYVDVQPIPVDISIRTVVNQKSSGAIQAILYGTSDFDVSKVMIETVLLGVNKAPVFQNATDDTNGDGFPDRILHFRTENVGLKSTDTELVMTGKKIDGIYFEGKAAIRIPATKK